MKFIIKNKKLLLIFLICLFFYFADSIFYSAELENHHLYTIVKFTDYDTYDGGTDVYFSFEYKRKTYKDYYDFNVPFEYKKGTKVFLMFNPYNLEDLKLIYDISVPDTLEIPKIGYWKELPKNLKRAY
jgi:hypothetical protein